ncbi:MAG: Septum formation initiator [Microgenomates group bacterium GW2011_GWA2_44_7]|nr:MAG: Septum formation initiator [Microgenomates group bacterium GW2011_GWA2_44_7]KKT78155.1 MAG: Septum formation initiator [Microgenomates group bacterium GW2011_GWB1_44_8]
MWYKVLDLKIVRLLVSILGIYISFQMVRNIWTLWGAKSRVDEAAQNLKESELKNRMLSDELKEVDSPEFAERQAREKLGLVKEGEVIFVLSPEEIKKLADSLREAYRQDDAEVKELTNWQKWRKYFFE